MPVDSRVILGNVANANALYGDTLSIGAIINGALMQFYGISGTARASFAVYNTKEEVDILVEGLKTANKMLS